MQTISLRGALVALALIAMFLVQLTAVTYAIDPGLGVGRPGPGVTWRGPAGVPGPAIAPAPAVVGPAPVVVAPAPVVVPAPVMVAPPPPPATYVVRLPAGCVRVIVNGRAHWRCGAAVYRPIVQSGRTVYVVVR